MTTTAAAREVRDGDGQARLRALAGVEDIAFTCLTFDECKKEYGGTGADPRSGA